MFTNTSPPKSHAPAQALPFGIRAWVRDPSMERRKVSQSSWQLRSDFENYPRATQLPQNGFENGFGAAELTAEAIVLLTPGDPTSGLKLHGEVAVELLCESILVGLPLHGATACGEFFMETPSILVGAAIDEAASWHEGTDWIGVIQTPSVHDSRWCWTVEV